MSGTTDNSLAIVFPGQGSQAVGMLGELAAQHGQVGETFAEAGEVLGYDLWQLVQDGPAEDLNQTDRTQPAMLAAGVSVWRVWQAQGGASPAVMAGHSLGEYTALVCSGAIDFAAAVALVAERGRCMQGAVPPGVGAMAALLGLDDATVTDVCTRAAGDEVVEAVNFNSPGQVVIAGNTAAVERAIGLAKEAGAKRAVILPVSVPSHCALMQPAAVKFAQRLEETEIVTPSIPVVQNVDAVMQDQPAMIRENLARQLYNPVLWVSSVKAMHAHGVRRMIEAGPGKVLTGLGKRIDKTITGSAVYDNDTLQAALAG
ncbi:MAG: ACP S-malonyltransferase [Thiohalobacterales bacterium]|nr:ACP S-malonyltransferase [Thiohalobacterales bacterium]